MLIRRLGEGQRILRKTGAAIAGARIQEFAPDPAIKANAAGDFLHIRAHCLAKVGHLVDESDLHRQEGVRRIFDQLGCAPAGEQDWRLIEEERAIQLAHHFAGALAIGADHNAVGDLEVLDGGAFAQEFRIGDHSKVSIRIGLTDDLLNLVARADRNSRLGHDDGEAVHQFGDFLGGGIDIGKVGMAVAAPRRCPHRDEDRVGIGNRVLCLRREAEAAGLDILRDEIVQAGLIDRDLTLFQPVDLGGVLVDAGHDMPEVGKTRPAYQAHIACPDHRYAHAKRPVC